MEEILEDSKVPLCVDLDGTLTPSDTLYESLILLFFQNPLALLTCFFSLLKGRAYFKHRVALFTDYSDYTVPLNKSLVQNIKNHKKNGRPIYLVTAANQKIARKIDENASYFDGVIASDDQINLKGSKKAEKLNALFGEYQYDYIGNDKSDFAVWKSARKAGVVHSKEKFINYVGQEYRIDQTFETPALSGKSILYCIRTHQWSKNFLIFLPVFFAHIYTLQSFIQSLIAFFSFSFVASSVYIINDLADLEADRKHAYKKMRPIASGAVPVTLAVSLVPLLLAFGFALSIMLSLPFMLLLIGYLLITTLYTFFLKKISLVDVFALSFLYSLRIVAGGLANQVIISPWLIGFSIFFFLNLAIIKRYSELASMSSSGHKLIKRGYYGEDKNILMIFGCASGYVSVLILGLFISSQSALAYYKQPELLWIICPLVLYWISRIWMKTYRNEMHSDPIVFAIRDKVSYVLGGLCAIVFILASSLKF